MLAIFSKEEMLIAFFLEVLLRDKSPSLLNAT